MIEERRKKMKKRKPINKYRALIFYKVLNSYVLFIRFCKTNIFQSYFLLLIRDGVISVFIFAK